MFTLNEKVVYPGHGVARINRILERKIAGKSTSFFELTFLNKEMTILVPIHNVDSVGIRQLSSQKNINNIFKILAEATPIISPEITINWNKRNKGYKNKIQRGNLQEICEIYRELRWLEQQKDLSFGEKNLLQQTEMLLAEEIALVNDTNKKEACNQLRIFTQTLPAKAIEVSDNV